MEESSSTTPPATGGAVKNRCLSFAASSQECFVYFKASVLGLVKKITAKNEKEATDADLQTAKMQVEAADNAEAIKNRLH
ncbi:hypothetical protein ACJIZ3_021682 [Penstemon smallii]|uniref:Uncharacterized protein n=1 Tax=Penstemon smallii TaxID=265156 RepID=A0ABD3SMA8_9LAMI